MPKIYLRQFRAFIKSEKLRESLSRYPHTAICEIDTAFESLHAGREKSALIEVLRSDALLSLVEGTGSKFVLLSALLNACHERLSPKDKDDPAFRSIKPFIALVDKGVCQAFHGSAAPDPELRSDANKNKDYQITPKLAIYFAEEALRKGIAKPEMIRFTRQEGAILSAEQYDSLHDYCGGATVGLEVIQAVCDVYRQSPTKNYIPSDPIYQYFKENQIEYPSLAQQLTSGIPIPVNSIHNVMKGRLLTERPLRTTPVHAAPAMVQ